MAAIKFQGLCGLCEARDEAEKKGFRNWECLLCEVQAEAEETVERREYNTTEQNQMAAHR